MPLLDEGLPVIRPVSVEILTGDRYLITGKKEDETENWKFPPGSIVKCQKEAWNIGEVLVAYQLVD